MMIAGVTLPAGASAFDRNGHSTLRALADDIVFVTLRVAGVMHHENFQEGLWDEADG